MATYKKNTLTRGASGSFGDEFVFRQVNGRTIITPLPKRTRKTSPKQEAVKKRFLDASFYAKAAIAHPTMKAEYTTIAQIKKFRGGAMVAAMTDYLTEPQLAKAFAHPFENDMGFPISIVLEDNYKGKEMTVSISNKDGTVTESGKANFTFGDTAWNYTTTSPYASIDGLVVRVTVKDRVGRVTAFEKGLNA